MAVLKQVSCQSDGRTHICFYFFVNDDSIFCEEENAHKDLIITDDVVLKKL